MRKIDKLKREAKESAEWRGHKMGRWQNFKDAYKKIGPHLSAFSCCGVCGVGLTVITRPLPNEIEIGGAAVAINCGDNEC